MESTGAYFLLKNKAIDGTDCLEAGKCINGRCVETGCDQAIHSEKKLDECGVCGGSNSTCISIEGQFDGRRVHYGYNFVARIPAGAANILIKQLKGTVDDDNSLALRSHNGSYLINGDAIISNYERVVFYDGVKIVYSGTGSPGESGVNEIESSSVDQNTGAEKEILRLSSYEQQLREEYNWQLEKLRRNRVSYSREELNRLQEQQHKIKEYRRQIENLTKKISTSSGQKKKIKELRPFVESISIKQALKSNLVVEVLSVGRLIRPEIVYRYSIHSRAIGRSGRLRKVKPSRTNSRDHKKSEDRRVAKSEDHLKQSLKHNREHLYNDRKFRSERKGLNEGLNEADVLDEKKEIDSKQLNFDKQNLKSNDQLILSELESYVRSGSEPEYRSNKRRHLEQTVQNETDQFRKHNIKIGQNLYVKRDTKRIQIRCPPRNSMRSLMNSKWFKNGKEIAFSSERPISGSGKNDRNDKTELADKFRTEETEQTARYQITSRGSLVIRNLQQTDSAIYACPFYVSYSQIFVI